MFLLVLRFREEALMAMSLENLRGCNASFLPIAAVFIKRIAIAEEVNRLCDG